MPSALDLLVRFATTILAALLLLPGGVAAQEPAARSAQVDAATQVLRTPRAGAQPLADQHAAALRALNFDVIAVGADLLHNDRIGTEAARAMLVVDEPRAMALILSTIPQAPPSVQLVGFVWFLEHERSLGDRLDGDARAAALRVLDRIPSNAMAELALYTIGMAGSEGDFPLLERFATATGFGTEGMRAASQAALSRLGSMPQMARLRAALAEPVPDRLTFQEGVRVVTALRQAAFSANAALVPLVCPHLGDPTLINVDVRFEPGQVAVNTLNTLLGRRSFDEWRAYCAAL